MDDVQGFLYKIREVSTDHLERPRGDFSFLSSPKGHKGEEEKLVKELEQITALAEAAIAALIRERS